MNGENLRSQGDRVAILVVRFGCSARVFGDRLPFHRVSANLLLLAFDIAGRSRGLEIVVGV